MKTKKIIAGMLSLCLAGGTFPAADTVLPDFLISASAEEEYTEGSYGVLTYKNYGDYIEISDCDTWAPEVEIPDEIDGVPVTRIGNSAFYDCIGLTSITISDNVTIIEDSAFERCSHLTSIIIPDSVTRIGNYAFCFSGLTSIVIPDSVTNIGNYAFRYCYDLISITIPDSITRIESHTFSNCSGLTSIVIPNSVTIIKINAFYGCSCSTIVIPDSVTSIEFGAFGDCSELTSITIKNPECKIYDNGFTISNASDEVHYNAVFTGTIYGYENSTAQEYAEKYGRNFVSLGESPIKVIYGDVNSDGFINPSDATLVLMQYVAESLNDSDVLSSYQKLCADVNSDGFINPTDATLILNYYSYFSIGAVSSFEDFIANQ